MFGIFKSKLFIILLITVILIVVIGMSLNTYSKVDWLSNIVSVPLSPVQKFFTLAGQKVQGSFSYFSDMATLKSDNEKLKDRVSELEKENREMFSYKQENIRLREALSLKNQSKDYDYIGGNIIAKDPGNWFNVFSIDRGTRDGIYSDFPVVTNKGLVGRVIDSDMLSSRIVTIIDMDSTVSARIIKSGDIVEVRGDLLLKDKGLCKMIYFQPDVDLSVGDAVETSGIGGIYPKGIPIGTVKEIKKSNDEMNRYAIIEPAVDFRRLEEVFVLKNKNYKNGTGSGAK